MDKLDKIFKEQRDAFDEEPLEGHFQRFEEKLQQFHSKKRFQLKSWPFLKIASVLIILLLSANLVIYMLPDKKINLPQYANKELNETANFYTVKINSGIVQLKQMADQGIGSEQELTIVRKELEEMDQQLQDLQKEYSKNPDDERVVNSLIEYYQTKLNIINTIKTDLENIKSLKNSNHENSQL